MVAKTADPKTNTKQQSVSVQPEPDRPCYKASEVAEALGMNERVLRRMCAEGRVPHVSNENGAWMFSQNAVDFLKAWPMETGERGKTTALRMLMAAIKADPRCKVRANATMQLGRVSPSQIKRIRALAESGLSLDRIAARIKVPRTLDGKLRSISKSLVSLIVRGKRHADVA